MGKSIQSHFSLHSPAKITGTVSIEKLVGLLRLKVTGSDNLSYQQQTVSVEGYIETAAGELVVYSPVDIDFWTMAALFVDRKENKRSSYELRLQGYQVIRVHLTMPINFKPNWWPWAATIN